LCSQPGLLRGALLKFQFSIGPSKCIHQKLPVCAKTVNFYALALLGHSCHFLHATASGALFMERNMMCALKAIIFMEPSLQEIYSSGQH